MNAMPLRPIKGIPPPDLGQTELAEQAELEKDVWDVRNLPGVRLHAHRSEFLLDFRKVPLPFRASVKRYLAYHTTHSSFSTCRYYMQYLPRFLTFLVERSPERTDLVDLTRADIEAYVARLRGSTIRDGKTATPNHIHRSMSVVRDFLEYLERTASPQGPTLSVGRLVWPEDAGKPPRRGDASIKYIPESVLAQLDQHIHLLPERVFEAVVLLRASGWRMIDVLNLRYDTCLEKTESGWWLCGDIQKTQVVGHRVPITEEIAAVAQAQQQYAREGVPPEENPERYLFPSRHRLRTGRPMAESLIRNTLNRLARRQDITDDQGRLYSFSPHSFRHTKGVELINNGMSLLHVQKWLAHASPEMTLTYARILDPTMRQAWEKAFSQGAVRIDTGGQAAPVAPTAFDEEQIEWEHLRHNLDAVRLPNGYCFKPKKVECPTQAIPCHTCHNFCTTPEFLPQFQKMRDETLELIQIGEQAGNVQWVERNQQNLERVTPILELLEQGKLHHPAGKAIREAPKEKSP